MPDELHKAGPWYVTAIAALGGLSPLAAGFWLWLRGRDRRRGDSEELYVGGAKTLLDMLTARVSELEEKLDRIEVERNAERLAHAAELRELRHDRDQHRQIASQTIAITQLLDAVKRENEILHKQVQDMKVELDGIRTRQITGG